MVPYSSYFLGVPGGPLTLKTWMDLRPFGDLDADGFSRREASGDLVRVHNVSGVILHEAIQCTAGADDTTRHQERLLRDTLAALR